MTDTTNTNTNTNRWYDSEQNIERGWLCSRCGRINAPWVRQCDCSNNWSRPTITWTYPGTGSHDDWWKTHVTCEQADANTYTTAWNTTVGGSDYWDPNSKSYKNTPIYGTNTIHDEKLKSKEK